MTHGDGVKWECRLRDRSHGCTATPIQPQATSAASGLQRQSWVVVTETLSVACRARHVDRLVLYRKSVPTPSNLQVPHPNLAQKPQPLREVENRREVSCPPAALPLGWDRQGPGAPTWSLGQVWAFGGATVTEFPWLVVQACFLCELNPIFSSPLRQWGSVLSCKTVIPSSLY